MNESNLVRLNKYIADCGIAARRKADELILHNKIMVNQKLINEPGFKINPDKDIVLMDGNEIKLESKRVYILLNKPVGYVTTAKDQFGRKTVMDLIKTEYRVYPVGRLDYDTSGLLILTNDGQFANKLMHPKFKIDKTYIAEVQGIITNEELNRLRHGVIIDDVKTSPAKVEVIKEGGNSATLKIIIHEGRNRQVRKMCEAVGHKVKALQRISLGNISLGKLKLGQWRNMSISEIDYLKNL